MELQTALHNMLILTIPWLEKVIRPIVVYLFLVVGLRLAGKRELAQLNPFDLVVLLTISNTVQNAIIGNDNSLVGGIIGATTLLCANYLMVRVVHLNKKIEGVIEGNPDILIDKGKVLTERLEREIISLNELEIAAHKQGFSSLSQVEKAFLEPDGVITFIARQPEPPEERQIELLRRLDRLEKQLGVIRSMLSHK